MAATAVVVVHGVVPHPPYDMQDQCAQNLCDQLNLLSPAQNWAFDVWEPPNPPPKAEGPLNQWTPDRTVSRVYRRPDNTVTADAPVGDFYDVIEAYWSPLDKGKTTALQVMSWMLATLFLPLNTTARYVASIPKKAFDIAYVAAAFVIALCALLGSLWFAALSLAAMANALHPQTQTTALGQIGSLISLASIQGVSSLATILTTPLMVWCVLGFVGGFLLLQGVKAFFWLAGNWNNFSAGDYLRWARLALDIALFAVGILLLLAAAHFAATSLPHAIVVVYFVVSAGAFVLLRTLLQSFFVNFFGDVEIYTTRDQNSDFFALRELILDTVTGTIGTAMSARDAGGKRRYDRVVILAHSLGSTIAMDALIRLYTLKEQAKALNPHDPLVDDFASIRAFVTFGTSLEKTRYFFDVQRPSKSEATLQFENNQYGVLFTDDFATLQYPNAPDRGIFWTNLWYLQDPVANEITSYLSYLLPGDSLSSASQIRNDLAAELRQTPAPAGETTTGNVICYNQQGWQRFALTPSHIIIHGLYLGDPWFWQTRFPKGNVDKNVPHIGVLDVVAARTKPSYRVVPPGPGVLPHAEPEPPYRKRFRNIPNIDAADLRDSY